MTTINVTSEDIDNMKARETPSLYSDGGSYVVTQVEPGLKYRFDLRGHTTYAPEGVPHSDEDIKVGMSILFIKVLSQYTEQQNKSPYINSESGHWGWEFSASDYSVEGKFLIHGGDKNDQNAAIIFDHEYQESHNNFALKGHFYLEFEEYTEFDAYYDIDIELLTYDAKSSDARFLTHFEYLD